MQHLKTQPDGSHLCLLSDDEFNAIVQRASGADAGVAAWRRLFLHHLDALALDPVIYNAIARATKQLEPFRNEYGALMPFESWAAAVCSGWWQVAGLGPNRLAALKAALCQR